MATSTPEIRKSHRVLLTNEQFKNLRIGKVLFSRDHGDMLAEAFDFATEQGWAVGRAIREAKDRAHKKGA